MSLGNLFRQLWPFVKPYRTLVIGTLILTAIGSFAAQVNAIILRYTVDHLNDIVSKNHGLQAGLSLLVTISIILLAIIDADKIIVLEKGRVVEQGTHETVYDKNGAYKKIFDAMAHSLNIEKIARTLND